MSVVRYFGLGFLLLTAWPAVAADSAADCGALDQMLSEARTDFTALKSKGFAGANCSYRKNEFKCAWDFSSDRYTEAEAQVEKLERCTAAQQGAERIPDKRSKSAFQVNPETAVFIRGPDGDSGNWQIQLKVTTTADWD